MRGWLALFLASLAGCSVQSGGLKSFGPLPKSFYSAKNPQSDDQVKLGRLLYYDPRLSKSQTVSCNTCHPLDHYGADGNPVSTGFHGLKGNRNSPTVFNAAGHIAQFWDGRAPGLEEQAKGPLLNPVEMAMPNGGSVAAVLQSIPDYAGLFREAFPGEANPVTFDNAAKAIASFERGLITPSRWDKYLDGDSKALTPEEKAGFEVFAKTGCGSCHAGPLVGGNIFQKLGVSNPWPDDTDMGVFMLSNKEADKMMFKVPSLRNATRTAPYFHNGKVATIEDAVRKMGHYQLGKELTDDEIRAIVTWLGSLTGEVSKDYVKPPELPKGSDSTPKPGLS